MCMARRSKDPLHPLPFLVAAGVGGAALEPGDVGFPFGLPREGGEAGHVALEVEVIDRVHDHEEAAAAAVDLHVQDADLALAYYDFRPHVGVRFDILGDEGFIVHERQGLAVAFHGRLGGW